MSNENLLSRFSRRKYRRNFRSKGFAYTTFAVVASSAILMLAFASVMSPHDISVGEAERIGEASFFVESLFSDMDRALRIATRRALTATTNEIVLSGEPLENASANISEALVNGTLEGEELNGTENASLKEWTSRVRDIAEESGYSLDVTVVNYSFRPERLEMKSSFRVFASLQDPATLATFNRTRSAGTEVSLSGLEDPMLLLQSEGRYIAKYERCGFSDPAEMLYTGSQNSTGYVQGYAVVQPADASAVGNKSDKILVAEDIDNYDSADVNSFAGSVSSQPGSFTPSNYYVHDTGSIAGIEENESLVLNQDQVWDTGFRQMFEEGCYIEDPYGPNYLDRMENELASDDGGVATLIDVSLLPNQLQEVDSAVGYVYFSSDDYGNIREVKGVTGDYSWFRLDQEHIDLWGMEELAE